MIIMILKLSLAFSQGNNKRFPDDDTVWVLLCVHSLCGNKYKTGKVTWSTRHSQIEDCNNLEVPIKMDGERERN